MKSNFSVDYISYLKTKIYQRTLYIGILVIILVWGLNIANDTIEGFGTFILPFSAFFCFVSLLLFKIYGIRYLKLFEFAGFGFLILFLLLQFIEKIWVGVGKPELEFQKILLWIAILYTFAFLVFPVKLALRWSIAFIFSIVVLGTGYSVVKWGTVGLGSDLLLLAQIYGSGLAYVSLLYATAKLKEKYTEAEIRSDMMSLLANMDALTGALSRNKIEELLNFYIANINSHKQPLSVMIMDLDKLKQINDTFGHDAGDYVLRRTVELLCSNLRDNDSLGRIGGDEFLIVCPNTDLDQVNLLAQRLEKAIADAEFDNIGYRTISVGVATYHQDDTPQLLMKRADTEMYIHKKKKT